jgi:hypothetical protein
LPAFSASFTAAGNASTSTLSPTPSAVAGETFATASGIRSVLVQSCSSPNVSKRKMCLPSVFVEDGGWAVASVSATA